jgi:hypothetical protein
MYKYITEAKHTLFNETCRFICLCVLYKLQIDNTYRLRKFYKNNKNKKN